MFYGEKPRHRHHSSNSREDHAGGANWLGFLGTPPWGGYRRLSPIWRLFRELGGVSQSSKKTAQALGLPSLHALFPYLSVAAGAFTDLSAGKSVYAQFRPVQRRAAGALAFAVLLLRAFTSSCSERLVMIRYCLLRRVHVG